MNKSLISIQDFSKEEILHILETAREFEKNRTQNILEGKVIACIFFEPSTRTRLSFETAVNRLGAKVIGFSDASNTSVSKGETLKDTIKMVSNYVDMIIMRHPLEGSSRYASEISSVPVVNAGDGANQHPSQTLLDLYSIMQTQGRLEGLDINMVGDLKYGRTTHSLLQAMSHFDPEFVFTSPGELKMPVEYKDFLQKKGIKYTETASLEEHLNDCDILYIGKEFLPPGGFHAEERPAEHEDPSSAAEGLRDRPGCGRHTSRILFQAGGERPLCPDGHNIIFVGIQIKSAKSWKT